MVVSQKGELAAGMHVLGPPWIPLFLQDAPLPALFDAGFAPLGPLYQREIQAVLGQRQPAYLFVTHSHFDHCGAAPYLKDAFPGLKAAASQRAAEVWQKPSAQSLIVGLNQASHAELAAMVDGELTAEPWRPFAVEVVVHDGQEIDLGGGLSVQCLATIGHTRDCFSYFIPRTGVLVCSEAAGIAHDDGRIFAEFLVDYDEYIESIQRLAQLDAQVLCQGHGLFFVGRDEVRRRLDNAVKTARQFRGEVLRLLDQENGDQQRVVELIKKSEYDPLTGPKQHEVPYLLNLRAKVNCLAQAAGA